MSPAVPNDFGPPGQSRHPPAGSGMQPTASGTNATPPPIEGPRSSEPAPAIPGYEILGFVGSGGQGDVYRARHVGLDRTVALKILRDSQGSGQLARFRREGRVIA